MRDLVPFGKYKGRPAADMLEDSEYMNWLEAQPWFREKFAHLSAARDAEPASRTPVHNKLQTLFLDENYRLAFIFLAGTRFHMDAMREFEKSKIRSTNYLNQWPDECLSRFEALSEDARRCLTKAANAETEVVRESWLKDEASHHRKAREILAVSNRFEALKADYESALVAFKCSVEFEVRNVDVTLRAKATWPIIEKTPGDISEDELEGVFTVEIKPTVADEYPVVLRQMLRNQSRSLFVETYAGEGATEDQFVSIFRASNIKVIFKRDVDSIL